MTEVTAVVALFGLTLLAVGASAWFLSVNSEISFRCAVVLLLWAIWAAVMRP
jgi:hypothetical protein